MFGYSLPRNFFNRSLITSIALILFILLVIILSDTPHTQNFTIEEFIGDEDDDEK